METEDHKVTVKSEVECIRSGCYYKSDDIQWSRDHLTEGGIRDRFWIEIRGLEEKDFPAYTEKDGEFETSWGAKIEGVDIEDISNDNHYCDYDDLDRDDQDLVSEEFAEKVEEKKKEVDGLLVVEANRLIKENLERLEKEIEERDAKEVEVVQEGIS